jgi:acetyl-CoA carboxylase, biotin carboxylase subunit
LIRKLLIANRGELAVRIARTCREMGVHTVAVHSEADRGALHTEVADEAHEIGPAPAAESYLRQDRILAVAKESGCDAVHPGYGFLAENAGFAQAVLDAGLIWVGPPPKAIAAMGSKTAARALMTKAGVPVVPGSDGSIASAKEAAQFAKRHGFPILLKAAAGGGGKGMRVVNSAKEIEAAFEAAQREAISSFGDGTLYVERFLERPRHIEIQVFADQHGNVIHLGERECSLQRRHQKIIEESPSAVVTPELRKKMGETAVAAARACGYINAGTVEMLLDASGQFYFLEMNTRLQVEHPVTEEVTGLDLVRLQLGVASGETLPIQQGDIVRRGHAIEVRIYAEDVPGGFLPSTGRLTRLRPATGPGLREDSGMREGAEVSRFYDPMISKLIARGESREAARQRMLRALREYEIAGVRTNIAFCRHILESEAFRKANFHTRTVENEFVQSYRDELEQPVEDEPLLAAALAHALMDAPVATSVNHTDHRQANAFWTVIGRELNLRDR